MSQSNPTIAVSQRGAPIVGADAANGFPVSSTTSSARTMRRPSVGRIDDGGGGIDAGQLLCSRADPDLGRAAAPTWPAPPGRWPGNAHSSSSDWMYIIDPPTTDRHRTAAGDGLDVRGGGLLVARDGRGLGDLEHVELVVRDAAALGDGQLGGADVHAAVELHRVGVHDFRRRAARPPQGPAPTFRCRSGRRSRAASWVPDAGEISDAVGRAAVELLGRPRRRQSARPTPGRRPGRRSSAGNRASAAVSPPANASSSAACTGIESGS